uniref:Uncharacterized protein n=1 Tax=Arundo donax TaxID=35708 RepID=A0A0A8Y5T1_ARUDO
MFLIPKPLSLVGWHTASQATMQSAPVIFFWPFQKKSSPSLIYFLNEPLW